MSAVLRQSGGALARSLARAAGRSSRRAGSPFVVQSQRVWLQQQQQQQQQLRAYASPPTPNSPNPKTPKKKGEESAGLSKDEGKKGVEGEEGKSAEESVDNMKKAEEEGEVEQKLAEGMERLSAEDQKDLDDLLETLKKGLPKSQVEIIEQSIQMIKKEGVPRELKELLDELRGKPMTLAAAAKLTRLTTQMARRQVEREMGASGYGGKKTDFSSNERKSSSSGSSRKDKKGSAKPELPNVMNVKMDMSTLLISAFVSYLLFKMVFPGDTGRDISYQEFRSTFFDKGLVEKLTVTMERGGGKVRVDLNREATQNMYPDSPGTNPNFHYYVSIGSVETFERRMEEAQDALGIPNEERIPISYDSGTSGWDLIVSFGPTLLLVGFFIFASRKAGGGGGSSGVFGMGKSRAKQFNHETDVKVKFADVAGMDEAKFEIMEFVSFLKTPEQFERLGAKIPRGAILSGPPGTGKTLLAKATAGESQVPFFSVSGSEFVEMFVGVGASRVRDLFAMARKNTPCIIFIDEIDAIGKARGKAGSFGGGNDEREATLNQILTEMDGFNTSEQVVVLAGTNRPDVLDKALMRPGRFDRHIAIDKPTMDGRKQIFLVHLKRIVTNEDLEYLTGRLSALTPGFSGADIANCVNEAALIAARTSAKSVTMIHFEQAIERVIGGLEKKSLVLSPEEKRVVAYHEAGHAICGWYFKYADPLLKVSIIPRGQGALGYAQYLPSSDSYLLNVNQLMDRMAMTLGGRISEELHFPTVTSGASDDFNKVTRLATAMVTKWGMSKKLGPLHFEDDENKFNKPFAEATAQTIDSEVRRIVDEAYKQCMDLLTEKKKEVGIVAEELLAKEVLGRDDMVRLLGKRPFDDNKDFAKYFNNDGGQVAPTPLPESGSEPPQPAAI